MNPTKGAKMILCCGEAQIGMIETDGAFSPHAGGAVFNTAIALGRLKREVGFLSGLSTDMFGTLLRDTLQASGALSHKRPDRIHLMNPA
jgi:fructokinase